jgi:hypothetical protein
LGYYVLDYLSHGFPTQLFEPFTDSEGNLASRPVYRDGQPVQCREAAERRDRMIERLASLAPVQGALDQIVQRFGTDLVAEVTGRSRRIVRKMGPGGLDRLAVEARAGSANLAEAQAFMDDEKRILVFSDAGGTGRSYHADLAAKNRHLRVHYLLEAGWKADTAIQGLGRSNRTNQAQPPLFRPIAKDVKAEKRFLSTIARRLDTLGAITKGQRQTGGQGLFRADDNLESVYGRAALRQLYVLLYTDKVEGCYLGLLGCDHESGDILRDEMDTQCRPEIVGAEVPEVFVEVAEFRRERDWLDPDRPRPSGQRRHRDVAGRVAVASDIEAAQRSREQDGSEMIGREGGDHGHGRQDAAKRQHGFDALAGRHDIEGNKVRFRDRARQRLRHRQEPARGLRRSSWSGRFS